MRDMSADPCIEELAPAVVVRAALFPLDHLRGLADAELAALADRATSVDTPAFDAAYRASMVRQRQALATATIEDPRFARALAMTNEDLSRRIGVARVRLGDATKRGRRLEATLYRYLARAVWRTEPCDLWAGVGLAVWSDEPSVVPVRTRYAISPDLRPYQFIVQALAETPSYIDRGIFKLNPTLTFDQDEQRWRYTIRSYSAIIRRERPSGPGMDALLLALRDCEPARLDDLADELRSHGFDDDALDDLLTAFQGLGLLIGGLSFPRTFASPWDALFAVAADLVGDHASAWRASIVQLRRLCHRTERRMDEITVEDLHDTLAQARAIPLAMAEALGVPPPPLPRSVLRCDTGLPVSIALGRREKERLEQAVSDYDRYDRHHGIDAAVRAAHRTTMLGRTEERASSGEVERDAIPTQESAWHTVGGDPAVGQRLERWSRWLGEPVGCAWTVPDDPDTGLTPPPIGALVLRPADDGWHVIGTTTEVGATYGRYGHLWYGIGRGARSRFEAHRLHEWFTASLAKAASDADVEVVEYVGPCEAMPNLLARPAFGFPRWDPWGASPTARADELRVDIVEGTSVPLIAVAGGSDRVSLTCFSPANVGFSEPDLERLLLSSFREMPAWLNPALPLKAELARRQPAPPLVLPDGSTVRLRRTFVHGAELADLIAASRSERFIRWRALAREHNWPSLVLVAIDAGPALPVVRDSPLAIEAALRGIGDHVGLLSVEEPPVQYSLADEEGTTHVFELIVPFRRRDHAWDALAPSERRARG